MFCFVLFFSIYLSSGILTCPKSVAIFNNYVIRKLIMSKVCRPFPYFFSRRNLNMSKVCRYRPYVVRKLTCPTSVGIFHISSEILTFPKICPYFPYIVRKLNMFKRQFMDLIPSLPVSSIIMLSGSLACPKSIGIFHILSGSLTCPKSVGIVHMLSGS